MHGHDPQLVSETAAALDKETLVTRRGLWGRLRGVIESHPRGLFLLFFVEMWERFSYYGMRAILVPYLITTTLAQAQLGMYWGPSAFIGHTVTDPALGVVSGTAAVVGYDKLREDIEAAANPGRGWAEGEANLLYGWYTGLAYLLPLIGGYVADKLLGTHRSVLVGGIVIALGHIVLAVSGLGNLAHSELGMSLFISGLALIVIGTGYFKPCASVMVSQLYPPGDPRRDSAFTIFYMGINLGALMCNYVAGTLGEKVGWHWGFGAAAVGMLAGLVMYIWGRPRYLQGIGLPPAAYADVRYPILQVPLALLLAAAVGVFYHVGGFGWLAQALKSVWMVDVWRWLIILGTLAAVIGGAAWLIAIQQPGERGLTASILIFMMFNAVFWIGFEQAGSTLNVFAQRSTDRRIPLGPFSTLFGVAEWEMPFTWFQSLNPFLILVLAPSFAWLWSFLEKHGWNPTQPMKIFWGLVLLGVGYVFIVIGAYLNHTSGMPVSMFWLTAMYLFHTLGELCLSPTGLAYVTRAAPARYVSLLMGIWFISSFLANLGGGIIASYIEEVESGKIKLPWQLYGYELGGRADYFAMFAVGSLMAALVILILTPLFKRYLGVKE
ncbi:MAG: peptide MFS transporter [Gemmatales bacterium]|nr:peptide MFS transporter [Gemmatales bacterium]MDW7993877.1 peptide MFS transporter [Gemmatales bacterium]